jgi:hypothetical protein
MQTRLEAARPTLREKQLSTWPQFYHFQLNESGRRLEKALVNPYIQLTALGATMLYGFLSW